VIAVPGKIWNIPSMPLCHIHWFSQVLSKSVGTCVLLPDVKIKPLATMYLLHGRSDDHTAWQRRTRIEVYAETYPLIVVMPDGGLGWYTRNDNGPDYAKYIGEELPAFIEATFHAPARREARCLTGLSMGGYGALRIALAYPDRFASAVSHSGALMVGSWPVREYPGNAHAEMSRVFGAGGAGRDHDLLHLAERVKQNGLLPALRIDCGTEDFLLGQNRACHQALTTLGVPHEYEEFPGSHNWDYWDLHVRDALAFHAKAMKLTV